MGRRAGSAVYIPLNRQLPSRILYLPSASAVSYLAVVRLRLDSRVCFGAIRLMSAPSRGCDKATT